MTTKRRQGNPNPTGFKAELKIKPLPANAEETAKQYLINLMLSGYILITPEGGMMTKDNVEQAMEAWNEAE